MIIIINHICNPPSLKEIKAAYVELPPFLSTQIPLEVG